MSNPFLIYKADKKIAGEITLTLKNYLAEGKRKVDTTEE